MKLAAIEEWDTITDAEVALIVDSMPNRCEAVIAANGGPTHY
jgi:hypothetical protein